MARPGIRAGVDAALAASGSPSTERLIVRSAASLRELADEISLLSGVRVSHDAVNRWKRQDREKWEARRASEGLAKRL